MATLVAFMTIPTPSAAALRSEPNNEVVWSANHSKVQGWRIERQIDGGSWTELTTKGPGETKSYTDTDADTAGSYKYRVVAYRGGGEATSNETSAIVVGGSPSSSLLTQTDLTYAGAFKMPTSAGGYDTAFTHGPLTFRSHGGTDRLLAVGYDGSGGFPVYETNIPALVTGGTVASFNTASVYKTWGLQPYGSLIPPVTNGTQVYGLGWDQPDQRLYFNCGPFYTGEVVWPTLGYCTLDDDTSTATPVGIWSFESLNHKPVKSGILRIPDTAFIAANCPGKSLAVGFGSGGFSIAEGHSMGPSLYAIAPPDTGTWASGTSLPFTELVSYPWNGSLTPSAPLRARRTADYDHEQGFFGMVASATSNTVTCDPIDSNSGNFVSGDTTLIGKTVSITAGTGDGQSRIISGISGFQLTVDEVWDTIPDATSEWSLNTGSFDTWAPSGDTGYWTLGDRMTQSMVWVKTASGKQAIVAFVSMTTGRQFYGHAPNHPVYESARHEIWLIDPAELAAVAQGTKTNYTVEPYERFAVEFPWVSYPLGIGAYTLVSGGSQSVGGVTLNADHTRMYVNYVGGYSTGFSQKPIIAAFDIAP